NVDALPTVLLEAMACGCPCVSTQLSGVPEIIEDNSSGLLIPPGDVAALGAAIGRLLADADLARRLAQGGRQRVESRFDLRRAAGCMKEWFAEALGRVRSADATA